MPIKDIMHVYECKFCKKKFTMFDSPNGELIFFPENVMWPVHGNMELLSHLRSKHRYIYDRDRIFHDEKGVIAMNYHVSSGESA